MNASQLLIDAVARSFNRIVVGAPTCKRLDVLVNTKLTTSIGYDTEYNSIACRYSASVYLTSMVIEQLPHFMKEFVYDITTYCTA